MDREKRRDVNFTREEIERLKQLIEQNKNILLNTKTTNVINRLKEETWNTVAEEFNSFTSNYRTPKQLKHKFENIKKRAQMEHNKNLEDTKIFNQRLTPGDSSDSEWIKGLGNNISSDSNAQYTLDQEADTTHVPEPPKREHRSHHVYRRRIPPLSEMKQKLLTNRELMSKKDNSSLMSQIQEMHKLEMAHKAEKHRLQMEHEERLNEAQLSKLAMEARLYEAQLRKIALETKQLELKQAREAEIHAIKMARDTELHRNRLTREAELHEAAFKNLNGM